MITYHLGFNRAVLKCKKGKNNDGGRCFWRWPICLSQTAAAIFYFLS